MFLAVEKSTYSNICREEFVVERFCSNCGTKLKEGAAFCGSCGARVGSSDEKVQKEPDRQHRHQLGTSGDATVNDMFFKMNGRLNRLPYFKRILVLFLVELVLYILGSVVLLEPWEESNSTRDGFKTVCGLIALYPELCLNVRRLQDLDKGKDWAYWIAGVGAIASMSSNFFDTTKGAVLAVVYLGITVYLMLAEGTKGENQYGPDPLDN